ncbi:MAG: DUF4387 family protein [Pseudomonadota bacterium]
MHSVRDVARSVRSKNAGPFWVTVDVFFPDSETFEKISASLSTAAVAGVLQVDAVDLKRFDLPDIFVIKFSFPRAVVQGSRFDRDMHGAQYANLVASLEISG